MGAFWRGRREEFVGGAGVFKGGRMKELWWLKVGGEKEEEEEERVSSFNWEREKEKFGNGKRRK